MTHDIETKPTVDSFDKYFGILLRSPITDYVNAATDENISVKLWTTLCGRAKIQPVHKKLDPIYNKSQDHFDFRASLVLEESREEITVSLAEKWTRHSNEPSAALLRADPKLGPLIKAQIDGYEQRKSGITIISCRVSIIKLTKKDIDCVRQGWVMGCMNGTDKAIDSAFLACVLRHNIEFPRWHKNDKNREDKKWLCFDLVVYRQPLPSTVRESSELTLVAVTWLLPLWRQFTAVTDQRPEEIPFIRALQGILPVSLVRDAHTMASTTMNLAAAPDSVQETNIHNEAGDNSMDTSSVLEPTLTLLDTASEQKLVTSDIPLESGNKIRELCRLNKIQEHAVDSFLNSAPSSITIVQG